MKTLKFCVKGQELKQNRTPCKEEFIVSNTHNYLQLSFQFNKEWEDYEKHIQFKLGKDHYEYLLAEDNTIAVPKLFVETLGFSFLIIGYNIENEERVTTNTLHIRLKATDWSDDITSYEDNTHDVYSLIESELENTYTKEQTDNMIGANVKQALNLVTLYIRTYGE